MAVASLLNGCKSTISLQVHKSLRVGLAVPLPLSPRSLGSPLSVATHRSQITGADQPGINCLCRRDG